jgi:hypothetical protein
MIRRLRLGNLRKLLRDRNGPILPDDDAGREYLWELLLPISVGPNPDVKMPNAIEVWAPWMDKKEAEAIIDQINLTPIYHRKPTAVVLGERLNLTYAEREALKLWTIAACDVPEKLKPLLRKQKKRDRMRVLRRLRGQKTRAQYLASNKTSKERPWIGLGISRRTYYYRLKTGNCTSPCQVKLNKGSNRPVQSVKCQVSKKESAEKEPSNNLSTNSPVKSVKPESHVNDTVGTVTAIELLAPTCATAEQIVEIRGTTCLNPDAVIGHNLGPPFVPDILVSGWSSPQLDELKWDDHWHLVYLRLSKTGEGVVSNKAA